MARIALTVALIALTTPARADVAEAARDVIAPAYGRLAASAAALDAAAAADCTPSALHAPYQAVWDDWARIGFLRLGPVETDGRSLAMAFWPDVKGSGLRAQQALVDADSLAIGNPADFARLSVALRGLAGLERLLYPSPLTGDPATLCALTRATAADLARMTGELAAEWPAHAALLTAPGNPTYLSQAEARQAIFTQIVTGLDQVAEVRLGRPMGSFDTPRPERAEALAAGRPLANVIAALRGLHDLTRALHPEAPQTEAAFARTRALAEGLNDPLLAGVATPSGRLKVEILQQAVRATKAAVETEVGGALNLSAGFNAADGD